MSNDFTFSSTPINFIHVSPQGSDTGDHSAGQPYRTIQAAVNAATPGTAIMVHAGTYVENVKLPSSGGTASNPIWLVSADGPQAAQIIAASDARPAIIGLGTDNVIIQDFYISGGLNGIQFSQSGQNLTNMVANVLIEGNIIVNSVQDGIKISQADNITISNNVIRNAGQEGIDFMAVSHGTIAHNEVEDSRGSSSSIGAKGGSDDILIANNYIHGSAADGIVVGGWSSFDYDSNGTLLYWRPGTTSYELRDVLVVGNVVTDVARRPINVLGGQHVEIAGNYLEANPTYYTTIHVGAGSPSSPSPIHSSDVLIHDNILSRPDRQFYVEVGNSITAFTNNTVGPVSSATLSHAGPTGTPTITIATVPPDAAQSATSFTLPSHLKYLTLTGADNISGTGNANNNVIIGNSGDNSLAGLGGADTINGGSGIDTVKYQASTTGVNVSLATGLGSGGHAEGDILINIENLVGSSYADALEGDGGNNALSGGAGIDTISYEHAAAGVTVNLAITTAQNTGGAGTDTLIAFENATGSAFNDVLTGTAMSNILAGGEGNDMLDGATGVDRLIGGRGNDTYVIDSSGDAITEYAGEGTDLVLSPIGFRLWDNIENVTLTGSASINAWGNAANNVMVGNVGNNLIIGLAGADSLDGGAGSDVASYAGSSAGVSVSLATGTGHGGDAEGDTLVNVENLTGSSYADTLEGNAGDNTLNGDGGLDTASYERATAAVAVSLAIATSQNTIGAGFDTLKSIENLIGSTYDDVLSGSSAANVLSGGDGNDRLDGGAGSDRLIGGRGDDIYVVDGAGDIVMESVDEGTDLVESSVSHTLSANVENLTLMGVSSMNGVGNALANVIAGNSGNNVLAGLAGPDILNGAGGIDTATYAASAASVTVSLAGGCGRAGDAEGDVLIDIENLIGSAFDDVLEGNAGNNALNGGAGIDTVSYERATARVTVSLAVTSAQNTGGAGTDTILNAENLTGSAYDDNLTGNSAANKLEGGDGDDVLNGGAAADVLIGGLGNDKFVFSVLADSTPTALDTIGDFTHGTDTIDLAALDANASISGNQAFIFGGQNANVVANSITWFESDGNTIVRADTNGNTTADVMIVLAGTGLNLGTLDFLL